MHKKYHEKFKILDILAVTTQAHEGIETFQFCICHLFPFVTTQAHEGIETAIMPTEQSCAMVTTQAHEGIETLLPLLHSKFLLGNNSSPHPVPVPGKKV